MLELISRQGGYQIMKGLNVESNFYQQAFNQNYLMRTFFISQSVYPSVDKHIVFLSVNTYPLWVNEVPFC